MNRTSLSIKNSMVSLIAQVITLVMQFVMQIVFVHYMSANYLGANGLFTNLMSILSFAELGIGAAITYSLYAPIANQDYEEIDAIVTFYKKIYRFIGVTILVLGLVMTLFLNFFVKKDTMIPHMHMMFLLYVIGTAVSYFYSYSRSMFIADQRSYVNTINQVGIRVLQNIIQILVLVVFQSYWMYLVLQIVVLEAMAKLKQPQMKLLVAGVGPNLTMLQEKVTELGITEQVQFLGYRSDITNIHYAADLNVFPSLREGLGLGGLESLVDGNYVIGSQNTGMADYLTSEDLGLLVDVTDVDAISQAIEQVYQDQKVPDLEKHRTELMQFDASSVDKAMLEIYKKYV
ncbi:glycosyltransferase [Weissella viridescens]|uniref:glycosyltransferase n=1 Tax=Weissella viridescens TaxID=1629 RepID=UPI00174626FF|nr:glycosyltransferase [Weissella viridescens]QOD85851.1 glycosyltransferase [Weissella viridescens]